MFKEKSSKEDLELLKLSVDHNRAKTIFNDMKELFDISMNEMRDNLE